MKKLKPPPDEAPAWAHRAWRQVSEKKVPIRHAAAAEGKHPASLRRYIVAGENKRQRSNYKRWVKENPDRARELSRSNQRARRELKGEEIRAYQRAYTRRPERRAICTRCHEPAGIDSLETMTTICERCRRVMFEELAQKIVKLWAEGKSLKEIAVAIGRPGKQVGPLMAKLRKRGYDLPYRYNVKA